MLTKMGVVYGLDECISTGRVYWSCGDLVGRAGTDRVVTGGG